MKKLIMVLIISILFVGCDKAKNNEAYFTFTEEKIVEATVQNDQSVYVFTSEYEIAGKVIGLMEFVVAVDGNASMENRFEMYINPIGVESTLQTKKPKEDGVEGIIIIKSTPNQTNEGIVKDQVVNFFQNNPNYEINIMNDEDQDNIEVTLTTLEEFNATLVYSFKILKDGRGELILK